MNVFLVTSPFQYICAREAKHHYKTTDNILVLVNQESEPGITQQKKLVDLSEWDHVLTTSRTSRSKQVPVVINKIRKLARGHSIEHFFHAEYNAWRTKLMLRNLDIVKEVYFDDGTLTINEYEEVIRPKTCYYRPRLLPDLLTRFRGCRPIGRLEQSNNLELFTLFDIPAPIHHIERNTLENLKSRYNLESLYDANAPIGFIGQGAIGHKRRKTIASYVKEISYFQKKLNKPIIYFPHRTESDEVRKQILTLDNITYHHSELPLEIELIDKQIHLSALVGILSTVQYTALMLYPKMPIFNLKNTNTTEQDYTLDKHVTLREARIAELFTRCGIEDITIE
ncbi:glycosyltransferase 52 family protein [Vibrio vulnificus]|nr:glycosyltransferase 52 family protein [Vibrio vulnificus]